MASEEFIFSKSVRVQTHSELLQSFEMGHAIQVQPPPIYDPHVPDTEYPPSQTVYEPSAEPVVDGLTHTKPQVTLLLPPAEEEIVLEDHSDVQNNDIDFSMAGVTQFSNYVDDMDEYDDAAAVSGTSVDVSVEETVEPFSEDPHFDYDNVVLTKRSLPS
jgi:hypothetical protein